MKITVLKPTDIHVNVIRCTLPFDEDDEVAADFPGRVGERMRLTLDLDVDTGKVRDWPAGRRESLHLKVRDEGVYELLTDVSASGIPRIIASRPDGYVPGCIPGEYGDYVICTITEDGSVLREDGRAWKPDAKKVAEAFFPDEE